MHGRLGGCFGLHARVGGIGRVHCAFRLEYPVTMYNCCTDLSMVDVFTAEANVEKNSRAGCR